MKTITCCICGDKVEALRFSKRFCDKCTYKKRKERIYVWREKNPDKVKASWRNGNKRWREKNPDKVKKYYKEHKKESHKRTNLWRSKNPHKTKTWLKQWYVNMPADIRRERSYLYFRYNTIMVPIQTKKLHAYKVFTDRIIRKKECKYSYLEILNDIEKGNTYAAYF